MDIKTENTKTVTKKKEWDKRHQRRAYPKNGNFVAFSVKALVRTPEGVEKEITLENDHRHTDDGMSIREYRDSLESRVQSWRNENRNLNITGKAKIEFHL